MEVGEWGQGVGERGMKGWEAGAWAERRRLLERCAAQACCQLPTPLALTAQVRVCPRGRADVHLLATAVAEASGGAAVRLS
jgi:hypothetical protein